MYCKSKNRSQNCDRLFSKILNQGREFFLTKNFGLRFDSACSFLRHLENWQRGEMSLSLEKQNNSLGGLHRLLLEDHRTCILHLKRITVIWSGSILSNLDKCGNLRIEPRIELRRVFVVRRGIADQQQGGNAKITFAKWSSHQIDLSSLKFWIKFYLTEIKEDRSRMTQFAIGQEIFGRPTYCQSNPKKSCSSGQIKNSTSLLVKVPFNSCE